MVRLAATFFLLALLATISGRVVVKGDSCRYLSTITGGCPDQNACWDTCLPCVRGVGYVKAECVGPGGGVLFWECRCNFLDGAPCPPPPPGPACPKPPSLAH